MDPLLIPFLIQMENRIVLLKSDSPVGAIYQDFGTTIFRTLKQTNERRAIKCWKYIEAKWVLAPQPINTIHFFLLLAKVKQVLLRFSFTFFDRKYLSGVCRRVQVMYRCKNTNIEGEECHSATRCLRARMGSCTVGWCTHHAFLFLPFLLCKIIKNSRHSEWARFYA